MPAGIADGLREADLTYTEVGATKGVLPPGYHHLHRTVTIGTWAQAFTAATDALAGWHVHGRAGLSVSASSPAAEPGSVLVLSLGLGAIRIGAPCRVVYVIDEPGRRGFAYGTLPGHPRARRGSLHLQPAPGRDGDLFHHCLLQPRFAAGQGSRTAWQGHPAPHHQPLPAGNHPLITFSRSGHITIRFSAHRMARGVPRPVSRAAGGSICMWRDRWSQECAEHVSDVLQPRTAASGGRAVWGHDAVCLGLAGLGRVPDSRARLVRGATPPGA